MNNNRLLTQGFTLLEVLVALAVLAVAMAAAIKVSSSHTENLGYLRDRTLAHWVAMNVITEVQVQGEWLATGKREGEMEMAEEAWFWRLEIANTMESELRRLEVEVRRDKDAEQPISVLTGFLAKQ